MFAILLTPARPQASAQRHPAWILASGSFWPVDFEEESPTDRKNLFPPGGAEVCRSGGNAVEFKRIESLLMPSMVAFAENKILRGGGAGPTGDTLIFTGPGPDNTWFTDDDVQSDYGVSDIIFQGRVSDPETQLYYFRTRNYSPGLGRFTNQNPWGFIQGRLNLYDFEKNSPILLVEPFSAAEAPAAVILGLLVLGLAAARVIQDIQQHPPPMVAPKACRAPSEEDPCPEILAKVAKDAAAVAKALAKFERSLTGAQQAEGTPDATAALEGNVHDGAEYDKAVLEFIHSGNEAKEQHCT